MKSKDLSRLEWHRLASANLQTYLAELEQFLARTLLPHQRPAGGTTRCGNTASVGATRGRDRRGQVNFWRICFNLFQLVGDTGEYSPPTRPLSLCPGRRSRLWHAQSSEPSRDCWVGAFDRPRGRLALVQECATGESALPHVTFGTDFQAIAPRRDFVGMSKIKARILRDG